jgi:thiosulfate/3-mercaptopyruvate sulfurtransferase
VDVRESVKDYWAGHLPGAIYFSPEALRLADGGVPVMLTPPDVLAAMLGRMGITPDAAVVVYTEKGDYKAPYLIWALDYIQHERAAVLDGGFGKWKAEGKPVTQDYPAITTASYPAPRALNDAIRVSLEDVKEVVERGGAVLLDVRPTALYRGDEGPWKRRGHIKGARHHFWGDDLAPEGVWRPAAELRATYEALGVTPDKRVIVSCGQGQMSAHVYFTLVYVLGYKNVANYDGSFNEWSVHEELPVETGGE